MTASPTWSFADAWIYGAIAVNGRRCTLASVISAADWINHAIPLDHEVQDALGKLTGAGLVRVYDDWTFELTDDGTSFWPGGRDPLAAVGAALVELPVLEPDVPR